MSTNIATINKKDQSLISVEVLDALREAWEDRTVVRDRTTLLEDGSWAILPHEFTQPSPIKRLNQHLLDQPELFHEFSELVKEDEVPQIKALIDAGTFELEKAMQCFKTIHEVLENQSLVINGWDESLSLDTPTIATFIKYKGEEKAKTIVAGLLLILSKRFGKRNDLGEEDIKSLSTEIIAKYRPMTFSDIKMVFDDAAVISSKKFNLDQSSVIALLEEAIDDRGKHFANVNMYYNEQEKLAAKTSDHLAGIEVMGSEPKQIKNIVHKVEPNGEISKSEDLITEDEERKINARIMAEQAILDDKIKKQAEDLF